MKYSIGAFPNTSMMMTMFNQLSDLDVSQKFGFRNQENNNQTQILMMNNFSKYFDVLLMRNNAHNEDANSIKFNVLMFVDEKVLLMDITDDDLLEIDIEAAAINKTANDFSNAAMAKGLNVNIPLLKFGDMLTLFGQSLRAMITDGALSVTNDNNLMTIKKQTLMAILNVVISDDDSKLMNMLMKMMNSNNKKLTNNCKIEINTDNINFSYYCDDDEYYKIIFNVSVFLSQKLDITMMQNLGSSVIPMATMYQLQSHLIQSFIVKENDDEMMKIDDEIDILTSTTSQSNTNKSEYAFERTLNNFNDDDDDDANVAYVKIKIISRKLMMMIPSKLFSFMQRWCSSFNRDNGDLMMVSTRMMITDGDDYTSSNDDDDAGYMMMISDKMQLKSLLQSFKESDQQSGIVSNNSCNTTKLISSNDEGVTMTIGHDSNNMKSVDEEIDGDQPMNISELIFSHINDKNDTLIVINADNTVNITCDFNYLNYKIKHKINDQIHKDKNSVKDHKSCYNNPTKEEESNDTTTTNTSSLVDKKMTITSIDELIECQRREKELMRHSFARRMRLCGGGEGSLSGASGWGSPPSNASSQGNSSNANAGQWGSSAQSTPQQNWNQAAQGGAAASSQAQGGQQANAAAPGPQAGQAQNASKPLTPGGPSGGWNQPPQAPAQQQQVAQVAGNAPGIVGGGTSAVAAKNQLEQLNSMREALFAQDGWGCQNVNQDTNWDVPGSPEPGPRGAGDPAATTQWKSHTVNNGTELWEANLRNGGQPPPQPVQKTPWNHTPSSNIGGTWGEDDDAGNDSSVWAGNQNQQAPGWNQGAGAAGGATGGTAMWPATPGKFEEFSTFFVFLIRFC